MNRPDWTKYRFIALALVSLIVFACTAKETVSFATEVKPILDKYCLECHQSGGSGFEASGLNMSNYRELMAGTDGGPMIIPGDSMGSNLLVLMEGRADPSIKMPHGTSENVSAEEINLIRLWIDQGAENN